MRFINLIITFVFFSGAVASQSLTVSSTNSDISYLDANTEAEEIQVLDVNGSIIMSGDYDAPGEPDPSLNIYALQNGGAILRENIANFLIYDSFGNVKTSISNSTQSKDGESISELAKDENNKTIVLYNPKVMNNGKAGSRAKALNYDYKPTDIFYSEDRVIKSVKVAETGEFIAITTEKSGTNDEVTIVDRYGNEINTISFDQSVAGVNLYGNASHITIFSTGRVAAYEVLTGKRLAGSTLSGQTVRFANYSQADQTIVVLTGNKSGNMLSNIELRVINIAAGKIASSGFAENVEVHDLDNIKLNRVGQFNYNLDGMSKTLHVKASF